MNLNVKKDDNTIKRNIFKALEDSPDGKIKEGEYYDIIYEQDEKTKKYKIIYKKIDY